MSVFLAGMALLAWIGGSDTERFLYWATPIVFVLIGRAFEGHVEVFRAPALLALLAVSQAISQRIFWTTPDFGPGPHLIPVLTSLSGEVAYKDLVSFHGERWIKAVSLAEYLALAMVLLLWLRHRARASRDAADA